MKKWFSSKHDSQETIEKVQRALSITLEVQRSAQVENLEPSEGVKFVIIDGKFCFISRGDSFVPFVGSDALLKLLPSITVDEGAIKFVVNGADIMRPGVVSFDDWGETGRTVVVREKKLGRAIAVGKATVASAEATSMSKGVCVENLHHVGDKYWTAYRQM